VEVPVRVPVAGALALRPGRPPSSCLFPRISDCRRSARTSAPSSHRRSPSVSGRRSSEPARSRWRAGHGHMVGGVES
jgi:hypothetical protein